MSFLEIQSGLWQANHFWSPDPPHLSVPEDLPVASSCVRIFRYLRDHGNEVRTNVLRPRLAQLRLHLSFVHLCNELSNPKSPHYKTNLNKRKPASHAIDDLMNLEGSDRLAPKDRRHFINSNAKGRRWYLISHYIGWGSLIIFNNIDATIATIDLPKLEAFITYVVNTQPRVVALCHMYEQPVKDLLNGRKPTLALTEKQVRSTVDGLSHATDCDGFTQTPWKRINTKIDTDVFEETCGWKGIHALFNVPA
ncbi:hypothetical protein F66182_15823, partial [Fusarium sp. NRRL 66182]